MQGRAALVTAVSAQQFEHCNRAQRQGSIPACDDSQGAPRIETASIIIPKPSRNRRGGLNSYEPTAPLRVRGNAEPGDIVQVYNVSTGNKTLLAEAAADRLGHGDVGHQPGPESSLFMVYATELSKDRYELLVRIAGAQGLGWEGSGYADEELGLTRQWLRSRRNSIEGGTSEIQLNIIAKRVLGLPD